jgi:glycosyltransferase involved in cell wall biosynthesis
MIDAAIAHSSDRVGQATAEMRTSIALCTYNGEAYIAEQLLSILGQTRRPSEIFIFDDGSTDRTVELAEAVLRADSHPDKIDWQININPSNVGVSENFCRAAQATTAEVVFPVRPG